MKRSIITSYLSLIWAGCILRFANLRALHRAIRNTKVRGCGIDQMLSTEQLCRAMDFACVFYPRRVLCLQRSAATAFLLRRHGIYAELVIGAQMIPFRAHAWVEVGGAVINDKPYMHEIYKVLERC